MLNKYQNARPKHKNLPQWFSRNNNQFCFKLLNLLNSTSILAANWEIVINIVSNRKEHNSLKENYDNNDNSEKKWLVKYLHNADNTARPRPIQKRKRFYKAYKPTAAKTFRSFCKRELNLPHVYSLPILCLTLGNPCCFFNPLTRRYTCFPASLIKNRLTPPIHTLKTIVSLKCRRRWQAYSASTQLKKGRQSI